MNYPLISEYIEAIKSAEDNFEELRYLRPVLGDDGLPVMTSGNFAVVFKMKDEQSGKFYAVKCFTKEQQGREEAYHQIAEELQNVDSPYLVSLRYLERELFVDTDQTKETEFPVLLMDWVEGVTLDKYLRENLDDKYALKMLSYSFSQLAQWLISHPFAHGDLKPENILVRDDASLVLVDYDGMYVPAMRGQKARELGSPDFRHPQRTEDDFDEHIDDFPLICMSLSLKAISINSGLLFEVNNDNGLLFTASDYKDIANSLIIKNICNLTGDTDYYRLLGGFFICISNKTFAHISHKVFEVEKPEINRVSHGCFIDPRDGYKYKTIKIGNQIWLAENLRYLPQIGNGYYVYDYFGNDVDEAKDNKNYGEYGVLYNMEAAKKACPAGWHIPSDNEWKELESYIGLSDFFNEKTVVLDGVRHFFRGNNQGSNLMKIDNETKACNLTNKKTEDFGFNASLGGWKYYSGLFGQMNIVAIWWSSSESSPGDNAYHSDKFYIYRVLYNNESGIGYDCCSEKCCLSLRCIKDESLPFPEISYKGSNAIPYPMPKNSVKKIIKQQFLQVEKHPYFNYLAILNTLIGEGCLDSKRIMPIWIPSDINIKVIFETKVSNVECTYYLNGEAYSFVCDCNPNIIDDVVELAYEIFTRLGLVGHFVSNGSLAIKSINSMELLKYYGDLFF